MTARLAPRRRHSLLAGRRAAKLALRHVLPGTASRSVRILPGVLDQPVVSGGGAENLQVTLSHAGSLAVAVAHAEACPIGVDLDLPSPEHRAALFEQTSETERRLAAAALDVDEDRRLITLWCLKEALSKALRCGLTVPFGVLEIASLVREGQGVRAQFVNFGQYVGLGVCTAGPSFAVVMPRTVAWTLADGSDPMTTTAQWLAEAASRPPIPIRTAHPSGRAPVGTGPIEGLQVVVPAEGFEPPTP
ncbi:4'-phosphopantetheinyl transferase family protein [Rhodoplanes roseus]|uniref:4'-phosphopantetheinyl transferase family protein n=1 Tax=Rhodoplanes roseus TaxID=29409 RepID=UPI001FE08F18|nr:4'-phosphopantetheinyl transferase superfamily protein [Rhodoplanes roseus]